MIKIKTNINKKAKGIRCDTAGMTLDAYIDRLSPKEEQLYNKKILQKQFQIRHNAMEMVSVEKKNIFQASTTNYFILWAE